MNIIPVSSVAIDEFAIAYPQSAQRAERTKKVLAGRTLMDSQRLEPFQPYFARASGPFKWNLEGRKHVDYWMGHGSLLLGHGHEAVVAEVRAQLAEGVNFSGPYERLIQWAELVAELIPCVDKLRFTVSGSEATQLALRIARAYTGRSQVLKFDGHYHGWHDEAAALVTPSEGSGINPCILDQANVGLLSELDEACRFIASEPDLAAVILEPGGGSAGLLPYDPEALHTLRAVTRAHGVLLIFDETISAFRVGPGGIQAASGATPDLCVLGKVLCGGYPGAAVGGGRELMSVFDSGGAAVKGGRVVHSGTHCGFGLTAAAGLATLRRVAGGNPQEHARKACQCLVSSINSLAIEMAVDVRLFQATSSIFHVLIGPVKAGIEVSPSESALRLARDNYIAHQALRRALLVEGIDINPLRGYVSEAHGEDSLQLSIKAFSRAFNKLREVPEFSV
jgi:glutamate-1-semialdehyde 2,1-aminomutase